jgi:hypothetical protein
MKISTDLQTNNNNNNNNNTVYLVDMYGSHGS